MKYWLCLPRISFWCLEIFYEGHWKIWKVIVKVETPFINISRDLLERKSQFFNPQNYLYELSYFTAWSAQIWSFSWSVFSRIQTKYVDLLRESPYSVRLRGNTDQKNFRSWTLFTELVFRLQFENYSKDNEMTLHQ